MPVSELLTEIEDQMHRGPLRFEFPAPSFAPSTMPPHERLPFMLLQLHDRGRVSPKAGGPWLRRAVVPIQNLTIEDMLQEHGVFFQKQLTMEQNRFIIHAGEMLYSSITPCSSYSNSL